VRFANCVLNGKGWVMTDEQVVEGSGRDGTDGASTAGSSRLAAAFVVMSALFFALVSFLVVREVTATDPCAQAQEVLLTFIEQFPDGTDLPVRVDGEVAEAGRRLHAVCTYDSVVEFESWAVLPWLGIDEQTGLSEQTQTSSPTTATSVP
jgi:hypothetical protein